MTPAAMRISQGEGARDRQYMIDVEAVGKDLITRQRHKEDANLPHRSPTRTAQ